MNPLPKSQEQIRLRERVKTISGHNKELIAQIITALDSTKDLSSDQEEAQAEKSHVNGVLLNTLLFLIRTKIPVFM